MNLRGNTTNQEEWIVEGRRKAKQATARVQHIWQYRHVHCIETVTRPCGHIIAWTKFATSESPTNIINMLSVIFPTQESRPSYIVIDKACRILVMIGLASTWLLTSRFLVDVFHFKHHSGDPTCQKYCNPTPSIRTDPNLVEEIEGSDGRLRRSFNSEAAEQLNAWFGGYASQLSHMHPANHDFLIQIMLIYHFNAKK
ncbi:hypothetical protein DL93DRAFT_2150938 [Clavulina sp. PMI_390]|nr:hypothetical protein DL93DRAFT_2150938 [Clavulina sp. PMI_390]